MLYEAFFRGDYTVVDGGYQYSLPTTVWFLHFYGGRNARRSFEFGRTHVVRPKARHLATIVWLHGLGDDGASASQLLESLPLPNVSMRALLVICQILSLLIRFAFLLPFALRKTASVLKSQTMQLMESNAACKHSFIWSKFSFFPQQLLFRFDSWHFCTLGLLIEANNPSSSYVIGFDVAEISEDNPDDIEGLDASAAYIANLLSTEPNDVKLGIGGFSMGAATALYSATCFAVGRYANGNIYPINLRAVVGLSGWLPGARSLNSKMEGSFEAMRRAASLPILLCHGKSDDVVAQRFGEKSAQALTSAGFWDVIYKSYDGLGHYTVPREMEEVSNFLASRLGL
ncbi:hypothetical protein Cgig2_014547 [Carnegiea gigantea]|uniref:Phospholipase/carboxylesterase/thioesterase domain-containing protein n=1 Tax=Carnegiea gigantea TaxID=171969 RepID=A0A9Q1L1H4_9CARY|nr:hypothetical protein Cgig2_014547 [Carnegiea gigantea]